MPAAPQGNSMLSHHLAQMSGNSNWYGHEGITWCGVLPVSLNATGARCDRSPLSRARSVGPVRNKFQIH